MDWFNIGFIALPVRNDTDLVIFNLVDPLVELVLTIIAAVFSSP